MRQAAPLLAGGWAPLEVVCPVGHASHRAGHRMAGNLWGPQQSRPGEGPREGSNLAKSEGEQQGSLRLRSSGPVGSRTSQRSHPIPGDMLRFSDSPQGASPALTSGRAT